MPADEAARYALSEEEPDPSLEGAAAGETPAGEPTHALTCREQEIARLVARGLANRQIASELFISERTVTTHLGKIFKKLEVHSREQVAGLFAEPGQAQDPA
jgi:DNA-binding NarL/FixJ family response regulator